MENKRLAILKQSLEKKEAALDARFAAHFDSVKAANGQPLNDKRNGQATLNRWEKQSDAIRNQIESVDITRAAIEREECKSAEVAYFYSVMPAHIQVLIDSGTLRQWGKHPHIMFVAGVDKARIYFDEKTGLCSHKYVKEIKDKAQYAIFRDVYNAIFAHNAPLSGK